MQKIIIIFLTFFLVLSCSRSSKSNAVVQKDNNLEKYIIQAEKYLNKTGNLNKAYEEYKKAEKIDNNNFRVFEGLGITLYYLSLFSESEKYLEKAYVQEKKSPKLLYHLAFAYKEQHKYSKSVKLIKELSLLVPKMKITNLFLGELLEKMNKQKEALVYYQSYLRLTPSDKNIEYKIGLLAKELKKWKLAINSLKNVEQSNKYPKDLHYHLAQVYIVKKDMKQAINQKEKYFQKNSSKSIMAKILSHEINKMKEMK